jgi:hypothetical protein
LILLFSLKIIFFETLNIFNVSKKIKLLNEINNLNFLSIFNLHSNIILTKQKIITKKNLQKTNIKLNIVLKQILNKIIFFKKFLTYKTINFYTYLTSIILPAYKFNLLFNKLNLNLTYNDFFIINKFNKNLHALYIYANNKYNKKLKSSLFIPIFLYNLIFKLKYLNNSKYLKNQKSIIKFSKFSELDLDVTSSILNQIQIGAEFNYINYMYFLEEGFKIELLFKDIKFEKIKLNINSLYFYKKVILQLILKDLNINIIEIFIISKLKILKNFKNINLNNLRFLYYNENNLNYIKNINNNFKLIKYKFINN